MSWKDSATEVAADEKTLGGFGSNLASSAWEFATDFVQMPKDLIVMGADGLGDLALGKEWDVNTDNPTAAGFKALATEEGRAALGQYYKDRYGGVQEFQDALYADPVGVMSDLAMFAMPAMAAKNIAKGVSKAGVKGADGAAETFEKMQRVLEKADPINLAGLGVATGVNKLAQDDYAIKLYQEIIKPSNSISPDGKARIIQHMLENGIEPNASGAANAQTRISDALAESDRLIDESTSTKTVNADEAMRGYYIDQAQNPDLMNEASSIDRAAAANARMDKLDVYEDAPDMDALEVRQQRRDADKEVKYDKEGNANTSSANAALNKGQADHLREILGDMVPEIRPLNKQISMDIPAKEFAELAAQRIGNNNTIGLGDLVGFSGGQGLGSFMRGLTSMAVRSPKNRARLARYIHSAKHDPLLFRESGMRNNTRNLLQFEGRQGEYVADILRDMEEEEEERRRREEER